MTSSEIVTTNSPLALRADQDRFNDAQVAALRHLGLQGQDADNETIQFSQADLDVFFYQCQRTGLDPFAKQIYMIMRKEFGRPKPTIQTGIDGFRKIGRDAARRHGITVNKKAPVWLDADGNEHRVWAQTEPPAAAAVTLVVDGVETEAVCNYREYVQRKNNGDPNSMWQRMPANMLAKCAEAAAWRMAFPADFSGLVSTDEPHTVIDVEADAPPAKQSQTTGRGVAGLEAKLASNSGAKPEPTQVNGGITNAQTEAIAKGLNTLFEGGEGRADYVRSNIGGRAVNGLDELTAAEADELLTVIAQHIAERTEAEDREREEQQRESTNDDANF